LSVAEDLQVAGLSNIRISIKEGSEDPGESPRIITICNSECDEIPPKRTESNILVVADRSIATSESGEQNDAELEPTIKTTYTRRNKLSIAKEKTEKYKHMKLHDTSLLTNQFEIVEGKRKDAKMYRKDDFGYLMSRE